MKGHDSLHHKEVTPLLRKCRIEAFVFYVKDLLLSNDPMSAVTNMEEGVKSIYGLRKSKKHMAGKDLGQMAPTHSLRYRAREETPIAA